MKKTWLLLLLVSSMLYAKAQIKGETPEVKVSIPIGRKAYPVPAEFTGFSYEIGALTDGSNYLNAKNSVLLQLIKNLGTGILRLGGSSSDHIHWTNQSRNAATGKDSLTTTDIDRFTAFAKATGWRVLFGLDLGENKPELNAQEAKYVQDKLQQQLYAFQIGNEPDLFSSLRPSGYSYTAFQTEWDSYYNTVKKMVPPAVFAGPDIANKEAWANSFAAARHDQVILIDGHHYHTSGRLMAPITYETILAPDTNLAGYLQGLHEASDKVNLPYRISECNSVSRGGKAGVSNVFASALWTLDFMWTVAVNKGQGINFHGGAVSNYAPIVMTNGIATPRPGYYAMLAFKSGTPGGKIVQAALSNHNYNCTAYACLNIVNTIFTLINKDTRDLSFNIPTGKVAASVQVARLFAPQITSLTDISFAGSEVKADGTFSPDVKERYQTHNKIVLVTIPAGSAAVITIK